MSMAVGTGGGPKSDPNITPYIDILLVLLIIFMVITPVKPYGFEVKVPSKSVNQERPQQSQSIVIQINPADNPKFVIFGKGRDEGKNFTELRLKLERTFSDRMDKQLFVVGQPGTKYSDIVAVIEAAKFAGVTDIGLMTKTINM
ncbi:MAG: biopolymer transporter ExbD [Acidobacteria bacterium]|nr:biopolymer transporter ExbD [Acidobacteriota bacterium]